MDYVLPARAGVILEENDMTNEVFSSSRASGGDPISSLLPYLDDLFFPHERW